MTLQTHNHELGRQPYGMHHHSLHCLARAGSANDMDGGNNPDHMPCKVVIAAIGSGSPLLALELMWHGKSGQTAMRKYLYLLSTYNTQAQHNIDGTC
jgi:hypothetical protein